MIIIILDTQVLQQQLQTEGTLWFKNLMIPDPFFLPILLALVNLVLIEVRKGIFQFQVTLLNVAFCTEHFLNNVKAIIRTFSNFLVQKHMTD